MDVTLLANRRETDSVFTLVLEKPTDFVHQPGQFVSLILPIENPDNRGTKRHFSLNSSPTQKELWISMKKGISSFKRTAEMLDIGTKVSITPPLGKFVLNEDPQIPLVMLTGGIGVTPFHAMCKYATDKKLTKSLTLLCSNKTSHDRPFSDELEAMCRDNPHLRVHHTITQDDPHWTGREGRIDMVMIRELIHNLDKTEFFIVGPPKMVLDLKHLLEDMQIPAHNIHFELFTGY